MQLTQILVLLAASSTTLAAPIGNTKSMMAASPEWTIKSLKRVCTADNSSCTWTFGIYDGADASTACTYVVTAPNASEANGGPSDCGVYTVTSGWSGQFGPGNGFTTLSVVDNKKRQIIWPGYTDKQLEGGNVVTPDQSYAPTALP
ncbi:hypothetical protein PISL3812_00013 [Talaromyces islandicus]|uniref:Small secreted protein n=1 Tax=Talaromyces islandicus TaxID=28573 RepID=A0A0U1LI27_TALIS|nr:hypothetical protein PISL3812_00013 [Talaromyces islandicus]